MSSTIIIKYCIFIIKTYYNYKLMNIIVIYPIKNVEVNGAVVILCLKRIS